MDAGTLFSLVVPSVLAFAVGAVFSLELGLVRVPGAWRKALLVLGTLAGAAILVVQALNAPLDLSAWDAAASCALVLAVALPAVALRALPWPQFVFTLCLVAVMVHMLLLIPECAVLAVPQIGRAVPVAVFAAVAGVAVAWCHLWFGPLYRRISREDSIGWAVQAVCGVVGVAMLVLLTFAFADSSHCLWYDATLTLFLGVQYVAQVVSLSHASASAMDQRNLQMFKAQALKQQELEKAREAAWEEERRRRHDQRHMLQVVIDALDDGRIEQAREHLEKMRGDAPAAAVVYCKNPTANSCIALWADRARGAGFDMTVRADVPEDLALDPVDVSVVFGNLLENAYEGCARVERTEAHRFIAVRCLCANGRLSVSVENSSRRDVTFVNGMPLTQKRGGGVGTHSVKATVEALGGMCSYELVDGVFRAHVVLPV